MNTIWRPCLALALLLTASTAMAGTVLMSGKFDGSESAMAPLPLTCDNPDETLKYRNLGAIQVAATGIYDIADASYQGTGSEDADFGVDVVIAVYESNFDPQNPGNNLVGTTVDIQDSFTLETNRNYIVVVQHWCNNRSGTYGISFSGPGNISGTQVIQSPDYWYGAFKLDDPQADFGLGDTIYNASGPVRFTESGAYFFSDLSYWTRTDLVLHVYSAPFNPDDPGENAVAVLDDGGQLNLLAGQDYYFVTYPWQDNETGDWQFVLFPPGSPAMNMFFEDAWNNTDMNYQGVLMTVLPTYSAVFLAWYTYDEAPSTKQSADATPLPGLLAVGDASQRWISAVGFYEEGASEIALNFENSFGGAFNSPTPAASQDANYGTGRLLISGCNDVTVEYDLPTGPGQGSYRVSRTVPDPVKVEFCEDLGLQPGVIE